MKIETNFVTPFHRLAVPLAAASWGVVLALAVSLAWLAFDAFEKRGEIPELRERLAQLVSRQQQTEASNKLPPVAELQTVKQRVAALNGLLPAQTHSVFSLLDDLEALVPDRVWLSAVLYRPRAAEVQLVAESESAEALTGFLLRLEKTARFSEVMLTRQAQQGAHEQRTVQFELRLKERP